MVTESDFLLAESGYKIVEVRNVDGFPLRPQIPYPPGVNPPATQGVKPKPPTSTNRGLKLPGFRQVPQMVSREGQIGGNQEHALKSKGNKSGIGKGSKYIEEAK